MARASGTVPRKPSVGRHPQDYFTPQSPPQYRSSSASSAYSWRRLLHGGRETALSARQTHDVTQHVWNLQCSRAHPRGPTHVARDDRSHVPARANPATWLRDGLTMAIRRDNATEIEALVLEGAPLGAVYSHRLGPAHRARFINPVDWASLELCFRAAMQILELGQRSGQNLATRTVRAVNLAAEHGHMDLLRRLLEGSAAVAQKNFQQESALHAAVKANQSEAAAVLLQHGAWRAEEQPREVLKLALLSQQMRCVVEAAGIRDTDADVLACSLTAQRLFPASPGRRGIQDLADSGERFLAGVIEKEDASEADNQDVDEATHALERYVIFHKTGNEQRATPRLTS
eukprot:TRINITY_DN45872_c0_g1_i1.p1 TRINITY_DN45872_c0_g1~~TRINITY_DN45872_c0_g1_i1.p1  ORF type:complete len:362 (-),score=38.57 TRINITY_DN45872_c0_g1_i1:104-1138(-)